MSRRLPYRQVIQLGAVARNAMRIAATVVLDRCQGVALIPIVVALIGAV